MKRYSKKQLTKFYAEQLKLSIIEPDSEPHQIVRCCKCDSAKLKFDHNGDGEMYYKCECGFESEPAGPAPNWLKS